MRPFLAVVFMGIVMVALGGYDLIHRAPTRAASLSDVR
jgi:hypothetical protein